MRRLLLLGSLLGATAFAGDARFNIDFGRWRVPRAPEPRPFVPFVVQPYVFWVVYAVPAPPPPAQVVYVERELPPVREQPPQVVVVQLPPAPVAPPEPPAPAPPPPPAPVAAPVAPSAPLPPRVPGPDVFSWTDDDGVVNYSTRVPAEARKRAKKLAPPRG